MESNKTSDGPNPHEYTVIPLVIHNFGFIKDIYNMYVWNCKLKY